MHNAGMGLHADKVPMDDIVRMAKFLVVAEILYVFNLVWSKLSILLMYYRIFNFPYFKKMAYIIGAFVIAWYVVELGVCKPLTGRRLTGAGSSRLLSCSSSSVCQWKSCGTQTRPDIATTKWLHGWPTLRRPS